MAAITIVELGSATDYGAMETVATKVVKNGNNIYAFYVSNQGAAKLQYKKSTNNGFTWGSAIDINTTSDVRHFDVWNDGTKIHIVWSESGSDAMLYRNLTLSTDALSTITNITGSVGSIADDNTVSICKDGSGNLWALLGGETASERRLYRSADETNWTDQGQSFYGRGAIIKPFDTNRLMIIWADTANDKLLAREYNGSAWDAADTAIDTAWTTTKTDIGFHAVGNTASGGKLYLAYAPQFGTDSLTKFKTYDATNGWIAKTNIEDAGGDDQEGLCLTFVSTSQIRCYYIYQNAPNYKYIYYRETTDGGSTWGARTQLTYFEDADWRCISADKNTIGNNQGTVVCVKIAGNTPYTFNLGTFANDNTAKANIRPVTVTKDNFAKAFIIIIATKNNYGVANLKRIETKDNLARASIVCTETKGQAVLANILTIKKQNCYSRGNILFIEQKENKTKNNILTTYYCGCTYDWKMASEEGQNRGWQE